MVTLATWNVENFYRPGSPFGPKTEAGYRAKLNAVAATISTSQAEVIGLQEVGDPAVLADLVTVLGGQWFTQVSSAPDSRGIRVAFLSKFELHSPLDVVDLPAELSGGRADDAGGVLTQLGRGALQVTATVAGIPITLINCHLKSKLLSFPGGRFAPRDENERARYGVYALNRRAAESGALRIHANAILDGHGRGRAVVLLGDLNDAVDAATTQTLLGPGGSEIGTGAEMRPDQGDAWRLWDLAPLIPEKRRYSRIYRGRGEMIDHVLISRALLEKVTSVDSLVDQPVALPSITEDPTPRRTAVESDHAPVVVTLGLG
jgi:endonuclease/exonuclease/phosphatase family metal-dependent hydrolase